MAGSGGVHPGDPKTRRAVPTKMEQKRVTNLLTSLPRGACAEAQERLGDR